MSNNTVLKIVMRNEATALPRILRIINRQGFILNKLVMQPSCDNNQLEVFIVLDCAVEPLLLVKLLQKQISVLEASIQTEMTDISTAV